MKGIISEKDCQIVRLCGESVLNSPQHVHSLRKLISTKEDAYPGILHWFDSRVVHGLLMSSRVAFLGYLDGEPVSCAVIKKRKDAKICHIQVREDLQNHHVGELLCCLLAIELRDVARKIHITMPESLWKKKRAFFEAFGFRETQVASTQYRPHDTELRCTTSFPEFWSAVEKKLSKVVRMFSLPKRTRENGLLMSIKPKYAGMILEGRKSVEIRKRFARKWTGRTMGIYSSRPVAALVGEARIKDVVVGKPNWIWDRFKAATGCTREEFKEYIGLTEEAYAILLEDVLAYAPEAPLAWVSGLLEKKLIPPQSYCRLDVNEAWAEAVSLAAMMGGVMCHFSGEADQKETDATASASSKRLDPVVRQYHPPTATILPGVPKAQE